MALFDKLLDFGEIDFGAEFSAANAGKTVGQAQDFRLGQGITKDGPGNSYPNNWAQNQGGLGLVMHVTEDFKADGTTLVMKVLTGTGVGGGNINAGARDLFFLLNGDVTCKRLSDAGVLYFPLPFPSLGLPDQRYWQIWCDPSANLAAGKAHSYIAPWVSTWKPFPHAANIYG